jgi:hypothetical protein
VDFILAVDAKVRARTHRDVHDVNDRVSDERLDRPAITSENQIGDSFALGVGAVFRDKGVNHRGRTPPSCRIESGCVELINSWCEKVETPPRLRAEGGVWKRTCLRAGYFAMR